MRFSIWIWQVRHDHSSDPLLLERASDLEGKLTERRIEVTCSVRRDRVLRTTQPSE